MSRKPNKHARKGEAASKGLDDRPRPYESVPLFSDDETPKPGIHRVQNLVGPRFDRDARGHGGNLPRPQR